jgi:hypothetical protein
MLANTAVIKGGEPTNITPNAITSTGIGIGDDPIIMTRKRPIVP